MPGTVSTGPARATRNHGDAERAGRIAGTAAHSKFTTTSRPEGGRAVIPTQPQSPKSGTRQRLAQSQSRRYRRTTISDNQISTVGEGLSNDLDRPRHDQIYPESAELGARSSGVSMHAAALFGLHRE